MSTKLRLVRVLAALLATALGAACSVGDGRYRPAEAYGRCDDGLLDPAMYPCGLRDRDGFDGSARRHDRDRPDRDRPEHEPPPFAGKDN